ncbi:hypothetical protein N7465_009087 [Penicillium sp. CMV-2018d]|nr:hypothetical protein N7465_009087 [Penicillium sp. CMV-2018d]
MGALEMPTSTAEIGVYQFAGFHRPTKHTGALGVLQLSPRNSMRIEYLAWKSHWLDVVSDACNGRGCIMSNTTQKAKSDIGVEMTFPQ